MMVRSFTFQSTDTWSPSQAEELRQASQKFFTDLKEKGLEVTGCLQSFTFPTTLSSSVSIEIADTIARVYKDENVVLLGGDTSTGQCLAITLIALIDNAKLV